MLFISHLRCDKYITFENRCQYTSEIFLTFKPKLSADTALGIKSDKITKKQNIQTINAKKDFLKPKKAKSVQKATKYLKYKHKIVHIFIKKFQKKYCKTHFLIVYYVLR